MEIIEKIDDFVDVAKYNLIDGQFIDMETSEIISKEDLRKSVEKQALELFYDASGVLTSLGITSNLRLIRARNGQKYFCVKIKEDHTFNKVFRVDMRKMLENVKLSERAQIFLFRFQHYLHFPSNTVVMNGEHPTIEKFGEIMGVKEKVVRNTLNELEKLEIISTQQIVNRRVVYFNPFLITSGGIIDIETCGLFEKSIYNPNYEFYVGKLS